MAVNQSVPLKPVRLPPQAMMLMMHRTLMVI